MAHVSERDRIQSLERGIEVLRAFGGREASLSVAEIATRTALARPVVRRILLTFEHVGFAVATNGQWTLTPRVLELSAGYFARSSLPEIAYGFMGEVVERTGMTCNVDVLDDGVQVIHVARVEDHRPLPESVRIGNRLPGHATAVGKVLLAALPLDALEKRLRAADLEPHTPHTITDVDELLRRIAEVRSRGWDVSIEELHPGQVAAAVPIVADGRTVGALAASSSTVRQSAESLRDEVVPVLRACATAIGSAYRNANPQLFLRPE